MPAAATSETGYLFIGVVVAILALGIPMAFGFCLARALSRKSTGWTIGSVVSGVAVLFYIGLMALGVFVKYREARDSAENPAMEAAPAVATGPEKVLATDGSCQFTIQAGWSVLNDLSDSAEVQVKSDELAAYLISYTVDKEDIDGWSLEKFAQSKRELLAESSPASHTEVVDLTVQKWPAKQWITRKTVDGVRFVYLCTCISTDTHFYYVLGWTLNSKFSEAKPALGEVIGSFKEESAAKAKK